MPRAFYSVVLDHAADDVWKVIRLFDHYGWAGVPADTIIEDGKAGDQIGAVRRIEMGDGIIRRQVLLAHSDQDRSYTYGICTPSYLPIENYVATIRVTPVVEDGKAFVEWSAAFDCAADERGKWVSFFENNGFGKWLGSLREFMAQRGAAADPALTAVSPDRIMQFTGGYGPPLVIETALRLGIFDSLNESAKNLDQLHSTAGASARGLSVLLNALVGLDLLRKTSEGRFELTPESAFYLVRGAPNFQGAFFLMTSEQQLPHWSKLAEIVQTGRPAQRVNIEGDGSKFFLAFVEGIFPIHYPAARCLAETLHVSDASGPLSVLDVAAGSGVWSIALAKQSPHVRVTAVDWAPVIPVTKKVTTLEGVAERYRFVEGDLLDADFGKGHSIATLGHILHSEGEERSRLLLKKTFDALTPGGTIAIAEILVDPDRRGPLPALMFAVNMLVHTDHGDTFSLHEISAWLREAGFEDVRTIDAPGLARQLIVATKPQ